MLAARAGATHAGPEALKGFACPGLPYRRWSELHLVPVLLVKATRNHHQVGTDVAREAPALAGVQALRRNVLAVVDHARNRAAIQTNLEGMLPVEFCKELRKARVTDLEDVVCGPKTSGLVKQEDDCVDTRWEVIFRSLCIASSMLPLPST